MKILLFFIDGLGLNEKNSNSNMNPFFKAKTPVFDSLFPNDLGLVVPTDLSQGISGIPQSATGQTALLTGKNAAKAMGRHKSGFPGPTLKKIIRQHNIFNKLKKLNVDCTFANAYTTKYVNEIKKEKRRGSVTTYSVLNSDLGFRYVEDIKKNKAVYQDFTNNILIEKGFNLKQLSPCDAAKNLISIIERHDFTLYEYFQSDIIGHSQDIKKAIEVLEGLDKFINTLLNKINNHVLIIITSDHGNIEDLSIKTHSKNNVPTFLIGPHKNYAADNINKIEDVTPTIIDIFKRF